MCRGLLHPLSRHDQSSLSEHFSDEIHAVGVALVDGNFDAPFIGAEAANGAVNGAVGMRQGTEAREAMRRTVAESLARVGVGLLLVSGSVDATVADCCASRGIAILPAAGPRRAHTHTRLTSIMPKLTPVLYPASHRALGRSVQRYACTAHPQLRLKRTLP